MRRLAIAMTLACVLSGVVSAGEIPTTGAVATPTPSPVTTIGETHNTGAAVGETHTTGAPEESSTVLTIILTLISIVP